METKAKDCDLESKRKKDEIRVKLRGLEITLIQQEMLTSISCRNKCIFRLLGCVMKLIEEINVVHSCIKSTTVNKVIKTMARLY